MMRFVFVLSLVLCVAVDGLLFRPEGAYPVDRTFARSLAATGAEYDSLGGSLDSSPHCLSRDGHTVHCFFTTPDNSVGYARIKNGIAEIEDLGGNVEGQPQTVGYGPDGVLAHFMTAGDRLAIGSKLTVAAVATGTKYDKKATVLELGTFLEPPGCVMLETIDGAFCVIRSTDGGMHSFRFISDDYERPVYISDNPNSPLTCDWSAPARTVHCWSTNKDNYLGERIFSDQGASVMPTWIHCGIKGRGRVLVKIIGLLSLPRALAYDNNEMVDLWGTFGGNLRSEPDCASGDSRSLDCFALDASHGIQRNYQQIGRVYVRRTSGWVHYGGSFVGKPSCVYLSHDNRFHCYLRNGKDELVEARFVPFSSSAT